MSDRLRAARNRLQADLQGYTVTMNVPARPENDEGYFEIIEGQYTDSNSQYTATTPLPAGAYLFGDTDDMLCMTVRSRGEPFVGKFNGTSYVESQTAEVIYFLANQPGSMRRAARSRPER